MLDQRVDHADQSQALKLILSYTLTTTMHLSLQPLLYGTLPLLALFFIRRNHLTRTHKLPPHEEHVLILGASGGVGRVLAVQYARRGARVCLVARNQNELDAAGKECEDAYALACGGRDVDKKGRVITLVADFSNVEDMVQVRERLQAGMYVKCHFISTDELAYERCRMGTVGHTRSHRRRVVAQTSPHDGRRQP